MRTILLGMLLVACGSSGQVANKEPAPPPPNAPAPVAAAAPDAAVEYPPNTYADLPSALAAIIPPDARVVGFGEIHNRVDRAQVKSALAWFTAALPSFGDKFSDLIVETWLVDPTCGQTAVKATKAMETEVKRPEATKSEVALLADAAKAAKIQPHAMTINCADYQKLVKGGQVDPLEMLTLTTRELKRISISAVKHRDKDPAHRPWVAVYGGALHNDRFPDKAVAEWSYAADVDAATQNHFVEIDLIVPELVAGDEVAKKQPWYPLVENAGERVAVFARDARSFVVVFPKAK
ncbi:MAG: hypothetical protein SFX73_06715 [Kofleriaceae bacterium]|nr:hypothetical protein [Kofleriaceae bacterium]